MSKLGFALVLLVLALAPLMPMAASPDQVSTTGTPTPIPTPTPIIGDATLGYSDDWLYMKLPEGGLDPQSMEDFRHELLRVVDDLNQVLDQVYPSGKVAAELKGQAFPTVQKADLQEIQQLTHEELYYAREAFMMYGPFESFQENVQLLTSLFLTKVDQDGAPSLSSFTVVPTPTPFPPPPTGPGIQHLTLAESQAKNDQAGNILTKDGNQKPDYSLFGVLDTRPPYEATFAALIVWEVARAAFVIANDICRVDFIITPGVSENASRCVAKKITRVINGIAEGIYVGLIGLTETIDWAEMLATFENTQILHSDLMDHDDNLTTRFNATDRFLFEFRNLKLRARIEANLGSPVDDPISLFALPSSICMEGYSPTGEVLEPGCGLLEVVSDTVRSAINMNLAAGESVNNAEGEFDAALAHYSNGEWKLAYARFRKAYREAVRP